MDKVLVVHNPSNLPVLSHKEFNNFQGDLKNPISPENIIKMQNSFKKHGIFVPKFIWFDNQRKAYLLDGHQTKEALMELEKDGWAIPKIPYVEIKAKNKKDAAEKLLQINSRYAEINESTTWLESFDFNIEMLELINLPEITELLSLNQKDYSFDDIEEDMKKMDNIVEEKIFILVPPAHRKSVEEWLSNGERNTAIGRGRGVLKRCGLL